MNHVLIVSDDAKIYDELLMAKQLNIKATVYTNETLFSILQDANIVFGSPSRIKPLLPSLPALQWVQSSWAGVEPLLTDDVRQDYILTNMRGVFGELMGEYVLGYLLAHEKRLFAQMKAQKNKQWDETIVGRLRGKTIGIMGVGTIGAHVAKMCKLFGMRVYGYTHKSENSSDVDVYYHDNLVDFVRELDYLVNILPNTPHTQNIINSTIFEGLPNHALFINVGRGSAVDEQALLHALHHEQIAGAVLDVFQQEPLPTSHPFWETPNLHMTFHTAALSHPEDVVGVFVDNYTRWVNNTPLQYQIDFQQGY